MAISDFKAADLDSGTLRRLRALETHLTAESGQPIVLVAYTPAEEEGPTPTQSGAGQDAPSAP